ncbi:MAG: glycerate dehydrogenase [Gammaproteobacteria bacterium SG8_15]|nr:MAG: glycerate dehydrogenase [Gammaproteobacteria bacterium SG8_15]
MKGVVLDVKSIDIGDIDFSGLESVVDYWQYYDNTHDDEIQTRIQDADIVVANKVSLQKRHIAQANQLKLICVAATGINNIDLEAAAELGVCVTNVTNYATPSVVQHVFCLILALSRKLNQYQAAIRDGRWQQSEFFCLLDYPVRELAGKTLGIIGYGVLGQAVATVGEAFGMRVLIADRKGVAPREGRVTFEQLMSESDVVSLHCPLTADTSNLIDKKELALMKSGALLINTARGGIVNETALVTALESGKLGGAGFDVLGNEPPTQGNPLLEVELPNLIVTPHIAWASVEARQRVIDEIVKNIAAFRKGEPRNIVA